MSDPLLSPKVPRTADGPAAPMTMLATRYPSGASPSLALLLMTGGALLLLPNLLSYAGHPLAWSDRISGSAILVLALAAAFSSRPWISWLAGAIGLWVVLAPVMLWAPSAGAYVAGTLIGALVVIEGLVLPLSWITSGDNVPPGWSYNPSSWSQRVPVIVLALVGLACAGYMAMFQLGAIDRVWDPIFGRGSERVLSSAVSRAWPVSDAGLGAAMFVIDALMTVAGDRRRWRTMPWMVLFFGVMIIPVGIVSIVLVILQPVAVGAWCFWCLLTAAATLAMIPLAIDEVTATVQALRQAAGRGESWWRVLWLGSDHGASHTTAPRRREKASVPWSLVVMALAGAWLMIAPAIIAMPGNQADSGHVTGALVIVVAAIAVSEIARPLRFLALPIALWVLVVPLITDGAPRVTWATGFASALVIALSAWPRGAIAQRRGSADRLAFWPVMMLLLLAAAGACDRAPTRRAPARETINIPDPSVDEVREDPGRYVDTQVRLAGTVDEVWGKRAFDLEGRGWAFADNIPVVTWVPFPRNALFVEPGNDLIVSGTLRRVPVAGLALPPELQSLPEGRLVLVADRIEGVRTLSEWSEKDAADGALVTLWGVHVQGDPAELAGTRIVLDGVTVRRKAKRGVWIGGSRRDQMFVATGDRDLSKLGVGTHVDVRGKLARMPPSSVAVERFGIKPSLGRQIAEEPLLIDATSLTPSAPVTPSE